MQSEPQKEHQWLQTLVGEWTMEGECNMGPVQPPMKSKATEVVRSLGGLWFIAEGKGDMPDGSTCNTVMTLGYDPRTKRYVGTWIGSPMSHLWIYDGEVDASGKVLTLNTEGPSFTDQTKLARYKDVIEVKSDDHRILTSHALGEDGKWTHFMTAHYRRKL
jgi:hypothetical protein